MIVLRSVRYFVLCGVLIGDLYFGYILLFKWDFKWGYEMFELILKNGMFSICFYKDFVKCIIDYCYMFKILW